MELGEFLYLPGGDVERCFLEISSEDLNSVKHETIFSYRVVDDFLRDYKSLDCSCCAHHFGYQHRKHPSIKICSSRCLAVVDQKLKAQASKMGDCQLLELYEIMNSGGRVKVDGYGSGSGPGPGPTSGSAKVGSMNGNCGSREPCPRVNGINENSCHGPMPWDDGTHRFKNKSKGWEQYYDRKSEKAWLEHEKKVFEALLMAFESEEPGENDSAVTLGNKPSLGRS